MINNLRIAPRIFKLYWMIIHNEQMTPIVLGPQSQGSCAQGTRRMVDLHAVISTNVSLITAYTSSYGLNRWATFEERFIDILLRFFFYYFHQMLITLICYNVTYKLIEVHNLLTVRFDDGVVTDTHTLSILQDNTRII